MQQLELEKLGSSPGYVCVSGKDTHFSEPQFFHLRNGPNKNITPRIRRTEFQPLDDRGSLMRNYLYVINKFFSLDLCDPFVKQAHSPFRPQLHVTSF